MKNFRKGYNLKIISLLAAVTFLLNSAVYGIDLPNKARLRVPVGQKSTLERIYKVMHEEKTEVTQVNGKIQQQIPRMLELSGAPVTEDWGLVQSQWKIEKLIYSPDGIQKSGLVDSQGQEVTKDEFGNYPHWVYEVVNIQNGAKAYVGPNDIETLFPQRKPEIAQLRKDKESLLTGYKTKVLNIYNLHSLFDINEIELSQLKDLLETDKIGDRDFNQIDAVYSHLERLWQSKFPDLALDRYINIMDDLTKVIKFLKSKDKHLSVISREEENRLYDIINQIEKGTLSSSEDIIFIDTLHEKLLNYQNQRIRESASWALGRPIAVNQDQEARAPAYGANLWIANWLNDRLKTNGKKPIILDVGANLSVFWRIFQQVSQDDTKSDGIIDLENNDKIYKDAPNPNGVLADISKPDESGLPLVRDAKNDVSSELLKTPNSCDIVITSFVLDQLEPEELKNSLISFENLLANPPQEELTQDNLDKFPLLIIASPEHAPLTGSGFEKALKEAGYTIIQSQYNLANSLSEETKNRILKEEGKERLEEIEKAISKPFHVGVYAKTKPAEKGSIEKAKLSNFALKAGQPRKRTNGDEIASSQKNRIDADTLYNLDIISSLKPSDFNVKSQNIVTRKTIISDPAYDDFEDRIACLIYFKKYLNAKDKAMLESIVDLWDNQRVGFLSEEQVKFVMQRPLSAETRQSLSYNVFAKTYPALNKISQSYGNLTERFKKQAKVEPNLLDGRTYWSDRLEREYEEFRKKEKQRNYPLYEIYELENAYRKKKSEENKIHLPSVFERTRTQYAIRIREIKQIVKEAPEGEVPNLTYIGEHLTPKLTISGLSKWLKDNDIDPASLEIIKLHTEGRVEQIEQIVKKAHESEVTNLTYVAERLTPKMTANALSEWLKHNKIDPDSLGITKLDNEERAEQIRQIVKAAPEGKVTNMTYVAERLTPKMTVSTLSNWFKYNKIAPHSLGIIKVVRSRRPSIEGSPAKCLETLYGRFKDKNFSIKDLVKERLKSQGGKFSKTTVNIELKELIKLGLVARTRVGKTYEYYLTDRARGFTPEQIASICAIPELNHFKIGGESIVEAVNIKINEIAPGGKFTSMGTKPHRLRNIDSLMLEIIEKEHPGEEITVIDFGVGYPPVTPSELAVKLSGKAKVIGVDIIVPAYAVEISGKLLEKEGVAWPFDYVAFFDENGNFMHYHSFVMGGSGSDEVKRKALAERLLKDALESGNELKEGEAIEREGCVVKYKPFKQYERENLSFEKGDFGFRSKEKADMIRVFNVMRHYKMEEIQDAITSLGENLKEGGTLIVGEEYEQGSTVQFIIYKKIKGEMVPVKFGVSIDTNTTSVGFNKKIGPLYTKYSSLMNRIDRYFSEHKEKEKAGSIKGSIVDTLNKIGIKATSSASGNVLIDIKSYDDFQDIYGNKNSGDMKKPTETFLRPWGSWGSHYFIENNYLSCTRTSI